VKSLLIFGRLELRSGVRVRIRVSAPATRR